MTPNDLTRVREEKARLYQSAVEAWGRGEVTAALGKLEELAAMDRDFPDPDSGRGSTYRNFYSQVQSENEAIQNAYEDARNSLANGNLDASAAVCQQYLSKYPNHPRFQALMAEVEARRNQPKPAPPSPQLAQAIADTDRRVEQEPDLDRRVVILQETLRQFPGEPHFQNALQAAADLRDLVHSIVAQARLFEQQGHLNDAIDQWQILKSIHSRLPGIASEIDRLMQRRDGPPIPAAAAIPAPPPPLAAAPAPKGPKGPWTDHAQKYLEAGDYQRAMQAVSIGLAESPGDRELLALDEQIRQGEGRANQALELLGKAHDLINKGATEAGLSALREAYSLDSRNTVIRTVLVNGLLEQARRKMDSDLQGADSLVQEVLRLEPAHAQALILAGGIAERKSSAPIAPPPDSLRDDKTLALGLSAMEPLRNVPPPLKPVPLPPPPPVSKPVPPPVASKPAPPPPPAMPAPPATPPRPMPTAQIPMPVPAPAPPAKPVPPMRIAAAPPKKLLLGTAAAVVLLVLIALGVTLMRHRPKPAPPVTASKYTVVLHSTPGAEIRINGDSCGITSCSLDLPPGNYQAAAQLTGYQSATLPIAISAGSAKEFTIALTPQGPKATIFTDLTEGTVTLDDAPAGQIQGGGAEIADLHPGKHVLAVKGGDSTASLPIDISPGAAPTLAGPIECKNVRCFLVAGFGGAARVYGGGTGYRITLDGKLLGPLPADGLPLEGLAAGSHELAIDSDLGQHDHIVFESQPSATLYVSLGTSQSLGTLSIQTNEDQAHLLINGQKYRRDTARGRLVVYLLPRKYTITLQKDGFAPPVEQTVEIKKGEETKVTFTLAPAKSILAVHHAPPGTDVQIDSISRGTVHPDGEFQVGAIEPGKHTVTLRHDGFKPLQSEQTFAPGKTLDLAGTLEAAPTTGTLRFEISPAGVEAHVRIRKDGDAQDREVTGTSVTVPEGHYVVSVSAPQYSPASASVQVAAGGSAVASVTLRHVEAPKAPPKVTGPAFGLEDWLKTPGWTTQNGTLVHKGGDWVMAPVDISQGTIRFTVLSLKGRHVEWAVAYRDEKNFIHYELDDKNLTRYEMRNGSKQGQIKVAHGLDKKKPMGITLYVTPTSVVFSVQRGGWLDIDKWDGAGNPVHGRFGFRIPGSDEIGLQDFTITAN